VYGGVLRVLHEERSTYGVPTGLEERMWHIVNQGAWERRMWHIVNLGARREECGTLLTWELGEEGMWHVVNQGAKEERGNVARC